MEHNMNIRRQIANAECETLVAKIKSITKTCPRSILLNTPYGPTMKFSYTFYNGTMTFVPAINENEDDFIITVVAMNNDGVIQTGEIPLEETPRIRLALLNTVCVDTDVIDFNK